MWSGVADILVDWVSAALATALAGRRARAHDAESTRILPARRGGGSRPAQHKSRRAIGGVDRRALAGRRFCTRTRTSPCRQPVMLVRSSWRRGCSGHGLIPRDHLYYDFGMNRQEMRVIRMTRVRFINRGFAMAPTVKAMMIPASPENKDGDLSRGTSARGCASGQRLYPLDCVPR